MRFPFRSTSSLIVVLAAVASLLPASASVEGYRKVQNSLALIGYPTGDAQIPMAFGSAFAVSADAAKRRFYLVTNSHVVTDQNGKPAAGLFALLPKDPSIRHPVTIVRRNTNLDIAIVSIDVNSLQVVTVSQKVPGPGDDIAIAGFPYSEVCGMAALCSPGRAMPNGHKGRLIPVLKPGAVNQSQEGDYSIMYDAKAEPGNSGGPLFDAHTGAVYGIVVDALPGFTDPSLPPQTSENRAIAIGVGLPFIDKSPVAVTLAEPKVVAARGILVESVSGGGKAKKKAAKASGKSAKPALAVAGCGPSRLHFDRAFGEWIQGHGFLKSIASYAAGLSDTARVDALQGAATRARAVQLGALATMKAALTNLGRLDVPYHAMSAGTDLVEAVTLSDAADKVLAKSLRSTEALTKSKSTDEALQAAAADVRYYAECIREP